MMKEEMELPPIGMLKLKDANPKIYLANSNDPPRVKIPGLVDETIGPSQGNFYPLWR